MNEESLLTLAVPLVTLIKRLLPASVPLKLTQVQLTPTHLIFSLCTMDRQACCPLCQHPSTRVHSSYHRTLADLPWATVRVQLHLDVRRFFCRQAACRRKVFCERLAEVARPYARRTTRLHTVLQQVAFALGGEAGARLCEQLPLPVQGDTLLAIMRHTPLAASPTPRVLGVDDWSFRRNKEGGTILVDLERHQPIELLRDCDEQTFASWLKSHPGVEVISRDRGAAYAKGATVGTPHALQVADRWHLMKNLGDAVYKLLARQPSAVRQAAQFVRPEAPTPPAHAPPALHLSAPPPPSPVIQPRPQRMRQLAVYEDVHRFHRQGWSNAAITRQVRVSKHTVQKYLQMDQFVDGRAAIIRHSAVESYRTYLEHRWSEGCVEVKQLWRELQAHGFKGGYLSVWRFVHTWSLPLSVRDRTPPPVPLPGMQTPTMREAQWIVLRRPAELTALEGSFLDAICLISDDVRRAYPLVQAFNTIIRERRAGSLPSWIEQACASGIAELRRFALGLLKDEAAVRASLTQPYSQGQVEGQVNRLKQLKRQMYGRANFDLLRIRVLHRTL